MNDAPAVQSTARPRSSGRPPKTTQQALIDCAIGLLEQEPRAGVSLNRIAKAMNISAMSIYSYFDSRNQLLQALTGQLLAGLQIPNDPAAPWQRRIIDWARTVRAFFQRVPYLIELLAWENNTSVAWLPHCLMINDVLHAAGLRDDELMQASLWTAQTIMSAIHTELFALDARGSQQTEPVGLSAPMLEHFHALQHFANSPDYYDRNFEYMLRRLLDALALQINQAHLVKTPEE